MSEVEETMRTADATPPAPIHTVHDDGTISVPDAKGRRIFVKHLNALDYYNVSKALGAIAATNPATLDMAMIACMVRQIDTTKYALPASERDVKFLIQALDFHGLEAVAEAIKILAAPEKLAKEKEDAKNLAGDPISN